MKVLLSLIIEVWLPVFAHPVLNEEEGYLSPTIAQKITCRLMMTGAFSRNVGKLFSEL